MPRRVWGDDVVTVAAIAFCRGYPEIVGTLSPKYLGPDRSSAIEPADPACCRLAERRALSARPSLVTFGYLPATRCGECSSGFRSPP
jgi:hypothetical protein